jgi:hypothetical protein
VVVGKGAGRVMIKQRVIEHFQKAPGTQQFVGDLAKQFNVSERQVQECIAGILRMDSLPGLAIVTRTRCWMYRPEAAQQPRASDKRMFEEIGPSRDGIVIQDDAGKLYLAREL